MRPTPPVAMDAAVRDATQADLDAMETLCKRIYKVTRRNEIAGAIQISCRCWCIRDGRICAYLIPMFFGHGVGESEDDMVALAQEGARRMPQTLIFAPLDEAELFRKFLAAGFQTVKMMNLMTMGPYDPPARVWIPSVAY